MLSEVKEDKNMEEEWKDFKASVGYNDVVNWATSRNYLGNYPKLEDSLWRVFREGWVRRERRNG